MFTRYMLVTQSHTKNAQKYFKIAVGFYFERKGIVEQMNEKSANLEFRINLEQLQLALQQFFMETK